MKELSLFKKKLAGYSAIASVLLAANHNSANAQIIHHDINPDAQLGLETPSFLLDMDNDGVYDFKFSYQQVGSNSVGRIEPFNNNLIMCTSSTDVDALSLSQSIGDNPPGFDYWSFNLKAMFNYGFGPWMNATDKFVGVILKQADGVHFGWVRLTDGKVIKDYAYQSVAETPIGAGEVDIADNINSASANSSFDAFVTADQLIINFQQSSLPSRMILLNDVGEKVSDQAITQSQLVMDVSSLAAGIYFVAIDGNEKREVKKIVIGQ